MTYNKMTYGDFKDISRTTAADKLYRDKAFNIANGYQRGLNSMVCKFSDKESSGSGVKSQIIQNEELAEELHKPIIRKVEKRKVYLSFIDNIWGTDLADMQNVSGRKPNKIWLHKGREI